MNEKIINEYWTNFLKKTNRPLDTKYYFCDYMGPTKEIADELLNLILLGVKTATTSCLLAYDAENTPLPTIGTLSIITDFDGNPKCIIENTNITIIPFKEMTYEICKREGEDSELSTWQNTHFPLLTLEGKELGYTFTKDTPIVFEDFKVIYK